MNYLAIASPLGALTLAADEAGICRLLFGGLPPGVSPGSDPRLQAAAEQLRAYFSGALRTFDLPLSPSGTAFQHRVWAALQTIPYGETRSYGAIAAQIGSSKASRAVGLTNHRNPIPILVPCHRVIGGDGTLTGYGGGLAAKRFLLELEQGQRTWVGT